jgi:signal transduction histidine kinase
MSHELRTPLNAIIGFTELMHSGKAGAVSTDQEDYLGDVLTSGRHLLELINAVLDLSKVEAGKIDLRPEPVDLGQVVGEVRDSLRPLAAAKHMRIDSEIDGSLGRPSVDAAKLKQILYNYLSNALKFTPDGGRITVRIGPHDAETFLIEVEDSGIGIPAELQGKLFVEFEQLDSGSGKRYQGTGLGLALTKCLVEAQGGHVGVRSTPGLGSTFSATLPLEPKQPATAPVGQVLEKAVQ